MEDQPQYRPGREDRHRRLSARLSPPQKKAPLNTTPLRRAVAALLTLVFLLLAVLFSVGSKEATEYDAQLTRSEPHFSAPLTAIRNCGRACTDYILSTDHGDITLGNADALHDTELGEDIEYVIDPNDPEWTIAVGEPDDWEPNPTGDIFILLIALVIALGISAWAIYKLVPEDIKRIFIRSPKPPSPTSSWGA